MPTPQIFISHSHLDDDFGKKLALDLRARLGEEAVWYDSSGSLHASEEWWNKIVAEITARDIFVVILSPSALESSWVRDEIAIAWLQKNRLGKRILPVIYLPNVGRGDLDTLHYVSFVEPRPYEDAFAQLLNDLSIDSAQTPRTPTGPLTNNDSRSQTLGRLTSEIHTAFGREDWTQVLSKTAFLAGDIPEGMTAQLWNERGLAAEEVHDGSVAVASFDASLKLDPYDIPTLRNRAHALMLVNQPADAARDLERAYNLVPLDDVALRIEVIAELVAALRAAQQWDAALQRTDEALRLAQGDSRWPRNKLDILEASGQETEALRYAETLMVTQRELALTWLEERYQQVSAQSNWTLASKFVDLALQLAPDNITWQECQVDVLMQLQRENEAWEVSTRLVSAPNATVNQWIQHARLAAAMKRREETKAAVESAAALTMPTDPLITQVRKELNVSDPATALRRQRTIRQRTLVGVSVAFLLVVAIILSSLTTSHANNIALSKISLTQTATIRSIQTEIASSNATATANALLPFIAQVPAADCANNGTNGNWQNAASNGDTIQCQSNAVAIISKTPSQTNLDDEIFFNGVLGEAFPRTYQVNMFINIGQAHNACAGVLARADNANFAQFGFFECGGVSPTSGVQGFDEVIPYDSNGKPINNQIVYQNLPEGTKANYSLTIRANGTTITFDLDSHQVASKSDVQPGLNDFIALAVDTGLDTVSGTDTVYFSHFSITSLS